MMHAEEARKLSAAHIDAEELEKAKRWYEKAVEGAARKGEHKVIVTELDSLGKSDEFKSQLRRWFEANGYRLEFEVPWPGQERAWYAHW